MQQVPYKMNIIVPLEKRDEELMHIEELIQSKRRLLLEKQKKIRIISKQNKFLDDVKKDYVKYYNYISQQKQDQIKALKLLNDYISDLSVSGNLSKHNMEDAKQEQKRIVYEMNSIKGGLDSIIDNTNHITSTLKEKNIIN